MLNGPRAAPVRAIQTRFSQPELGAARKIQAVAPRKEGVANAAKTMMRIALRPGMSVRLTAQARTVPKKVASRAAAVASTSESRMGVR